MYDEEIPSVRKIQRNIFIQQVMLLAAARPRQKNAAANGNIGCWAFLEKASAIRNSRNRAAGTLVTKCVEVTKDTYKARLSDDMILAIKQK